MDCRDTSAPSLPFSCPPVSASSVQRAAVPVAQAQRDLWLLQVSPHLAVLEVDSRGVPAGAAVKMGRC